MYFRHNLLNLVEYRLGLTFQRLASYTTFGFLVGRTLPSLYAWILVVVLHLHQIHYPVLEHFFSVWIIENGWLRNHFLDCILFFTFVTKVKHQIYIYHDLDYILFQIISDEILWMIYCILKFPIMFHYTGQFRNKESALKPESKTKNLKTICFMSSLFSLCFQIFL